MLEELNSQRSQVTPPPRQEETPTIEGGRILQQSVLDQRWMKHQQSLLAKA